MQASLLAAALLLSAQDPKPRTEGSLGLETRAPTPAEAKDFGLKKVVIPWHGQMVTAVDKGGPAEKAGIVPGDVVLRLNDNKIYSIDTMEDFLAVTPPGAEVKVLLKRARTFEEQELRVTLASRPSARKGIAWEFASLEQLDAAVAKAKLESRKVLVGISGAET